MQRETANQVLEDFDLDSIRQIRDAATKRSHWLEEAAEHPKLTDEQKQQRNEDAAVFEDLAIAINNAFFGGGQ